MLTPVIQIAHPAAEWKIDLGDELGGYYNPNKDN